MAFSIQIQKQKLKFSSTHFTIFSSQRAERLHGHNYQVGLKIYFQNMPKDEGLLIEFHPLKKAVQKICYQLDEKILIPENSPHLEVKSSPQGENIQIQSCQKFYSFPKEDCKILQISNTSSECLAQWFHKELRKEFSSFSFEKYEVTIEESSGQSVTYTA